MIMVSILLLIKREKKCFNNMGKYLRHLGFVLLCMLVTTATFGQTKNVVRSEQTRINQKSSSSKTTAKSQQQITITAGEYVDLGLPSGTLWATRNIGASKPEEYGDYFAWGETKPKKDYSWETYQWCEGASYPLPQSALTKYNPSTSWGKENNLELNMEDDAAYVNWGEEWRMPSIEQFKELIENCSWKFVTYKGVKGYHGTGKNGNSIFFPDTGYRSGTSIYNNKFRDGDYWSRTIYYSFTSTGGGGNVTMANSIACDDGVSTSSSYRFAGLQIRPVRNM